MSSDHWPRLGKWTVRYGKEKHRRSSHAGNDRTSARPRQGPGRKYHEGKDRDHSANRSHQLLRNTDLNEFYSKPLANEGEAHDDFNRELLFEKRLNTGKQGNTYISHTFSTEFSYSPSLALPPQRGDSINHYSY